jgi:hypothetical protein
MKKFILDGAILFFGFSSSLTLSAVGASAQGPAGAGAPAAAQETSHSHNPLDWVKKDSKVSTDALGNRSDIETKLTPILRAHGLLGANTTATDACAPFTMLDGCLATLHASHNLGVDFICLRAAVTGVHTSADVSGCTVADGETPLGLRKAIHQLEPDANAKQAAKDAEQQAEDDLKRIGG